MDYNPQEKETAWWRLEAAQALQPVSVVPWEGGVFDIKNNNDQININNIHVLTRSFSSLINSFSVSSLTALAKLSCETSEKSFAVVQVGKKEFLVL